MFNAERVGELAEEVNEVCNFVSAQPPSDAGFVEVVGGHFHLHTVANGEADEAFAHLAADGGEDEVLVVEFDAEHGSGQDDFHATFDFDVFFFH